MLPSSRADHGQSEFVDDASSHAHGSQDATKNDHRVSTHGPVEMYSGHHVNVEPVELAGHIKSTVIPKKSGRDSWGDDRLD